MDEDFRELEREAERDPYAAERYIQALKRTPHTPLTILVQITSRSEHLFAESLPASVYGAAIYEWNKLAGKGPCSGLARELNDSMNVPVGIKAVLHEFEGDFYFNCPLGSNDPST